MKHSCLFFLAVMVVSLSVPVLAQKKSCENTLKEAHLKLANLYESSTDSTGYSIRINLNATLSVSSNQSPEQRFHMAATKRELFVESDVMDSYQDDSVRITVFKDENKIFIGLPSERDAVALYMQNFGLIQNHFVSLVAINSCTTVKGITLIEATPKKDTLGLGTIDKLKYTIDREDFRLTSLEIAFKASEPIRSYLIQYIEVKERFVIPSAIREYYHSIANRSREGESRFEKYTILDSRKKINP